MLAFLSEASGNIVRVTLIVTVNTLLLVTQSIRGGEMRLARKRLLGMLRSKKDEISKLHICAIYTYHICFLNSIRRCFQVEFGLLTNLQLILKQLWGTDFLSSLFIMKT